MRDNEIIDAEFEPMGRDQTRSEPTDVEFKVITPPKSKLVIWLEKVPLAFWVVFAIAFIGWARSAGYY